MADAPAADDSFGLAAKKRRRRFWVVLLLVVLVPAIAFTVFRVTVSRKLAARLESLRQAGYPTTLQELNDWYREPTGENAAAVLLQAYAKIIITKDQENLDSFIGAQWDKLFRPVDGGGLVLTDDAKKEIEAMLASNAAALKLLYEGAAIKESRYPINFLQGNGTRLPDYEAAMRSSALLGLEAVYHANKGQKDAAVRSLLAMFGVARSFRNDPVLISQLVRLAMQLKAQIILEWVVNRFPLDDKGLVQLLDLIVDDEEDKAMERGFAAELVLGQSWFSGPTQQLAQMFGRQTTNSASLGILDDLFMFSLVLSKLTGRMDLDRLNHLEIMEGYIRATLLPTRERYAAMQAEEEKVLDAMPVTRAITPSLSRALLLHVRGIAILRVAQAALAVERYRLAHGKLPEKLDDVAPEFLKEVPPDPFTGKPLGYKKLEKGFTVYSVGDDLTDHGGVKRNAEGKEFEPGSDIPFTIAR